MNDARQVAAIIDRIIAGGNSIPRLRHLQMAGWGQPVDADAYLNSLCETLLGSMANGDRPVKLTVSAEGATISSGDAINIGLIVTEAVINALKYAFAPDAKSREIAVAYEQSEAHWLLLIADNGVGIRMERRLAWAPRSSRRSRHG